MSSTLKNSPRIIAHHIAASRSIPNHPRWPLLVYPGVVATAAADLPAVFEELFDHWLCSGMRPPVTRGQPDT